MINMKTPYQRVIGEFEGYACKFSPFEPNKIACGFSQYFGIIGNGRLSVFSQNNMTGVLEEKHRFNTNDGIFDIAWSEANENQIISGCGDGSLKLWDVGYELPLLNIKEHAGEIFSVSWNHTAPTMVASGGMDSTVKIYDMNKGVPVNNLVDHKGIVYCVTWHPTISTVLCSASDDKTVKIWETRQQKPVKTILAHFSPVMHCDFNKYENTIATAGADGSINIFDLRGTGEVPLLTLNGHKLTTRKLQFSPFFSHILVSVSYDMNVIVWNTKQASPQNIFKHHREFVYGLDFSLFENKKLATIGWDKCLYLFNFDEPFNV